MQELFLAWWVDFGGRNFILYFWLKLHGCVVIICSKLTSCLRYKYVKHILMQTGWIMLLGVHGRIERTSSLAKGLGSNPAPSLNASLACWHEAPRNTERNFDSIARTFAGLSCWLWKQEFNLKSFGLKLYVALWLSVSNLQVVGVRNMWKPHAVRPAIEVRLWAWYA